MNFPPFPTQSAYGSFPSFPTYTFKVDLPSFLGGAQLFSVSLPNLAGIPTWIAQIFAYFIGWIGAFLLWLVQVFVIVISDPIDYLVNLGSNAINWTIQEIESISSHAGIFAPVVAALLMGMLLVVLVVGLFAAINLLKGLGGAAE